MITNGLSPFNDIATPTGTSQALTIQQSTVNSLVTATQSLALVRGLYNISFYARARPDDTTYNAGQQITASLNNAAVTTSLTAYNILFFSFLFYSFYSFIP